MTHIATNEKVAEDGVPNPWHQIHGQNIVNYFGAGAGAGAGAMALWHLLRGLKQRGSKSDKYQPLLSGAPVVINPEKAANSVVDSVVQAVGSIPDRISDAMPTVKGFFQSSSPPPGRDPNMLNGALATTLGLGAGVAGLYGGGKLVNSVMEAKHKRDAKDDVDAARNEFYAVLTGANKKAAALDAAFEQFQTKQSNPGEWLNSIGQAFRDAKTLATDTLPRGSLTSIMLPSAAAAAVGAKYMYDRTAERTQGENLAKAQESRARMKVLPTIWVDPEQVAHIKRLAEQNA